jgi:hypothetical protein
MVMIMSGREASLSVCFGLAKTAAKSPRKSSKMGEDDKIDEDAYNSALFVIRCCGLIRQAIPPGLVRQRFMNSAARPFFHFFAPPWPLADRSQTEPGAPLQGARGHSAVASRQSVFPPLAWRSKSPSAGNRAGHGGNAI